MNFISRTVLLLLSLLYSNCIIAQTILYNSGFGVFINQIPPQWVFSGDNMNVCNVGPSNGYFGASSGVYWAEGNHKGFLNTNGIYMNCSQPGVSSATLLFSSAGHTDLQLIFGMCKSGITYNSNVTYSLSCSADGINFTPVSFNEPVAGRWGVVDVSLPASVSNQANVYVRWEFSRTVNTGFFKVDDVKIVANDFCVTPQITSQPLTSPLNCIGSSICQFSVSANGTGPLKYQWQEDNVNITDGTWYSGTQSSVLEVLYPHYGFNGKHYRCIITNCSGDTVISDNTAQLQLKTILGDLNFDAAVNNSDFVELLVHWGMTCNCTADLNLDNEVDLLDYLIFVGQFSKSCN